MKKLIKIIDDFFNGLAKARAASVMASAGRYDEATKKILSN